MVIWCTVEKQFGYQNSFHGIPFFHDPGDQRIKWKCEKKIEKV